MRESIRTQLERKCSARSWLIYECNKFQRADDTENQ